MGDQVAGLRRLASDGPGGNPEFGDVLELSVAEVVDLEIEASLDLPVGLLGEADGARLGDAPQAHGDVDAVAHKVAVALLDGVTEKNADAKLEALFSVATS